MATLADLRTGIATNLGAITGLRTSSFVPDDPKPPVAVVMPDTITFDRSFGRGLDEYRFTVMVIVGKVSDRAAQAALDAYCNPTGASSIKTALEADTTLGGRCADLRVTEMRNYQSLTVGEVTYLAAEFVVQLYAQ